MSRIAAAVSIVVPVYNTSRYLRRCLDSLLNQSLDAIQIVVVDDASHDESGAIVQEYARRDRRVCYIRHDSNQGLHVARISGVQAAQGEFLGYVDSDDYAAPEMFASLYDRACTDGADVVRTGAELLVESSVAPDSPRQASSLTFAGRTFDSGIDYLNCDFYPSMCLHLHHRRLWERSLEHFPRMRLLGEDNLTSFVLASFAGRVVSLETAGYCYVERDDSLSGDRSFSNVMNHIRDRGAIVRMLRRFVAASAPGAMPALERVESDNRGLLLDYIGGLASSEQRAAASSLFESEWAEAVPSRLLESTPAVRHV